MGRASVGLRAPAYACVEIGRADECGYLPAYHKTATQSIPQKTEKARCIYWAADSYEKNSNTACILAAKPPERAKTGPFFWRGVSLPNHSGERFPFLAVSPRKREETIDAQGLAPCGSRRCTCPAQRHKSLTKESNTGRIFAIPVTYQRMKRGVYGITMCSYLSGDSPILCA